MTGEGGADVGSTAEEPDEVEGPVAEGGRVEVESGDEMVWLESEKP